MHSRSVLTFSFAVFLAFTTPVLAGNDVDGMVLVPEGEFLMGSTPEQVKKLKAVFGKRDFYKDYSFDNEAPQKKVWLKALYIDRSEVTNAEYARFIKATGHTPPRSWVNGKYANGKGNHPVLYVSQKDARAYAKWCGKRLPTAIEWEKAARGANGLVFPWGNEFDPYKAATAESDIKLIFGALCSINSANMVGMAEGDVSPYGVHDMAGNVREWTSTYSPEDKTKVAVKGGSWLDLHVNARAAHTEYVMADGVSHIIGFRCVKDVNDVAGDDFF